MKSDYSSSQVSSRHDGTQLLYLKDTYAHRVTTVVTDIGSDDLGSYVVCESSLFHPQNGGQPSDRGYIRSENTIFRVEHTGLVNGMVYHHGCYMTPTEFTSGDLVEQEICAEERLLNARYHTAGELIRIATMQLYGNLVYLKGCHFPDAASVEFSGVLPSQECSNAAVRIEEQVNRMINANLSVVVKSTDSEVLKAKGIEVPSGLCSDQPIRTICIAETIIPCGGTHVRQLGEIGSVQIRKLKAGKQVRVSYVVL